MAYNIEIAQARDRLREEPLSTAEGVLDVPPPAVDAPARVDETGVELKRGAFLNTIAMLASNFRGIFTFLVARMLGPAALGVFSVAWSTTDILSKIGVLGLDNAIITFIARSEAVGDHARSRVLFRVAVVLGVAQSAVVAVVAIVAIRLFHHRLHLQPGMVSALAVVLCAMPGLALYRISTSVSRGMKVMRHDILSRGMTEPIATTLAFLVVFIIGLKTFAPELAAIIGTATSGLVALALAAKLFRGASEDRHVVSHLAEARQLIGYSAPISAYQLINAFIARLDLIMLGYFAGRAPGVTLATVGVYSAVIGTANGLRKVNQAFNPIFAPVVAGMTATGDHETAAATYARLAQWMLWILLPLVAVMSFAGGTILLIYGPAFRQGGVWLGIVALASVDHMRRRRWRASMVDSTVRSNGRGVRHSFALCRPRDPTLRNAAMGVSLERLLERYSPTADCCGYRACSGARLPRIPGRNCRTSHQRINFPGSFRCSVVAAPYPSQGRARLVGSEDVPSLPKKCDRLVIVILAPIGHIVQR